MNCRVVVTHTDERAQQARTRNGVVTLLVIRPTVVVFEQKLECFRWLTETHKTHGNL
jgi:hypothetical protein